MRVEQQIDESWLATGEGPMRMILAEGNTRREAMHAYTTQYGRQYEEQERATHFAMRREELDA